MLVTWFNYKSSDWLSILVHGWALIVSDRMLWYDRQRQATYISNTLQGHLSFTVFIYKLLQKLYQLSTSV